VDVSLLAAIDSRNNRQQFSRIAETAGAMVEQLQESAL
jgi:hypothetical protein